MFDTTDSIIYLLLIAGMILSFKLKKLTLAGSLAGGLIGFVIFIGAGLVGLALLAFFFISGSLVTSHQTSLISNTSEMVLQENKRTAGQVFANGGFAALAALMAYFDEGNSYLYIAMLAASLASSTSDTFSSELGTVYGKRFFNCLTFKPEIKGENGVISLEGILFGIIGAVLIAVIYSLFTGSFINMFWIIIAGLVGNLCDSVLGATLERKHYINNNVVNFISSLIAALVILFFI